MENCKKSGCTIKERGVIGDHDFIGDYTCYYFKCGCRYKFRWMPKGWSCFDPETCQDKFIEEHFDRSENCRWLVGDVV